MGAVCCCCDKGNDQKESLLKPSDPEGGYYQAEGMAGELTTKPNAGNRFNSEGEDDDDNEQDSYDEETDAEIEPSIIDSARSFFRSYDAENTELYVTQFAKLLKRRRYRRMIIYLGNRNVDEYKNNIRSRIEDMCNHIDPKPEEHMREKVLEAMVKLSLEASIRILIVDCINSKMSCE